MNNSMKEQIIDGIADEYLSEALSYRNKTEINIIKMVKIMGKVAACLVLICGIALSSLVVATASGNIEAYDILYSLYPYIADKLIPVNVVCEDEGIRMEVEGISVHGNCADIYISIMDTEGNRIDETIDLFDSYTIHTNVDQIGGCSLVNYDAESGKATFLINVQHMDGSRILGKRMTFSVSKFLSGKKEAMVALEEINPDAVSAVIETQSEEMLHIRGGSWVGEGGGDYPGEFLLADESKSFEPTEGVAIMNYGFINGQLHVQVYYEDISTFDNHGFVFLKDESGNEYHPQSNIAFWDAERVGSFEEYIFDVTEDEFHEYTVQGHFFTCKNLTEGNWKVDFGIVNQE